MSAGTGAIRITSAEIGAIDIMKPSRAQSRALDRSLMRVLSLMRLSLGGGAGLAIGAARALGAAEDGSRDGGRSIRRRPRAQRAPCLQTALADSFTLPSSSQAPQAIKRSAD